MACAAAPCVHANITAAAGMAARARRGLPVLVSAIMFFIPPVKQAARRCCYASRGPRPQSFIAALCHAVRVAARRCLRCLPRCCFPLCLAAGLLRCLLAFLLSCLLPDVSRCPLPLPAAHRGLPHCASH